MDDIKKDGTTLDQCVITEYFNRRLGFSILYKRRDDTLQHWVTPKPKASVRDKFKISWTDDEIDLYGEEIENILNDEKNKYDSLLYFISGHGADNNILYTSDGWDYSLEFIFHKFNNATCIPLRNLSKIFFIEMGRQPKDQLKNSFHQGL